MIAGSITRRFSDHRCALRLVLSRPKEEGHGEDRWALGRSLSTGDERCWVLCDGASEGWDSGRWASVLSRSLAQLGAGKNGVARARRLFGAGERALAKASEREVDPQAWLSSRARMRGSWSTALVVRLRPGGLLLEAWAVGDSCLFLFSDGELVASFPKTSCAEFCRNPDLICAQERDFPVFQYRCFPLAALRRPSFALASDALAAAMLAAAESGEARAWDFARYSRGRDFRDNHARALQSARLACDDLTLLWIG